LNPRPRCPGPGVPDRLEDSADRLAAIADDPSPDAAVIAGGRTTPREGLLGVVSNLRDAAAALRTGLDPQSSSIRPDEVGQGLLRLHQVCDQAGWLMPVAMAFKQHKEEITERLNDMAEAAESLLTYSEQ